MAPPNTPAAKTERLMNLVMTLLATRRPLPKARIREIVEQYRTAPSTEAFDRMFERDKDDLRELGIPLVTEEITALFDDEPGYRIHQRDYALPDLALAPDELAVLGLAARTWSHAALFVGPSLGGLDVHGEPNLFIEADILEGVCKRSLLHYQSYPTRPSPARPRRRCASSKPLRGMPIRRPWSASSRA